MAEPASSRAQHEAPPIDPTAIDRAYLRERARRRARVERRRATKRAGIRFWVVLLALLAVGVLMALSMWREIERLFGL